MCSEHMWLLSVCRQGVYEQSICRQSAYRVRVSTGRENLLAAVGAVELRGALLRGLVITEHQVAQV